MRPVGPVDAHDTMMGAAEIGLVDENRAFEPGAPIAELVLAGTLPGVPLDHRARKLSALHGGRVQEARQELRKSALVQHVRKVEAIRAEEAPMICVDVNRLVPVEDQAV